MKEINERASDEAKAYWNSLTPLDRVNPGSFFECDNSIYVKLETVPYDELLKRQAFCRCQQFIIDYKKGNDLTHLEFKSVLIPINKKVRVVCLQPAVID